MLKHATVLAAVLYRNKFAEDFGGIPAFQTPEQADAAWQNQVAANDAKIQAAATAPVSDQEFQTYLQSKQPQVAAPAPAPQIPAPVPPAQAPAAPPVQAAQPAPAAPPAPAAAPSAPQPIANKGVGAGMAKAASVLKALLKK